MKQDYFNTLTKEIIENNDKEKAIKIIANKLNEKQLSNEKEILTNIEKDKEIERLTKQNKALNEMYELTKKEYIRLNNIIKEVREIFKDYGEKEDIVGYSMYNITGEMLLKLLEILDKGE